MASSARLAANRANAEKSTGPRTPEGKARSSQNSIKHGLSSRGFVVRDDETGEFEQLRDSLYRQVAPRGALEITLFRRLLHATWNLHRIERLEAELFHDNIDPLADPSHDAQLDRLARYQSRFERSYYRALRELRTIQTGRILKLQVPARLADVTPALSSTKELLKRTQPFDPPSGAAPRIKEMELEMEETEVFIQAQNGAQRRPVGQALSPAKATQRSNRPMYCASAST